jgi:ribosome-associated heat shock protein Hsp15
VEAIRVDRWLWAVRICKTRTAAGVLCAGGHVRVNGAPAKPATKVRVGDRVEARVGLRDRVLEVVVLHEQRVGAAVAAEAFVDRSPRTASANRVAPAMVRDRGAGRPTKRDRRAIDRMQRG